MPPGSGSPRPIEKCTKQDYRGAVMARAPCFVILFGILFATPARGQLPDSPATGFKSNIDLAPFRADRF